MAASMPVLSNSTTNTATTTPINNTVSAQLWPKYQAPGKTNTAKMASCLKAGSPQPARKPSTE
jgi:hypothetical protein